MAYCVERFHRHLGEIVGYEHLRLDIVKTIQTDWWHHLPVICCHEWHGLRGRGVQYISLFGCKLPQLDGYVAVCQVLTIKVYNYKRSIHKLWLNPETSN